MASNFSTTVFILTVLISSSFSWTPASTEPAPNPNPNPTPTPWPLQFHSILVMRYNGENQIIDLWYDWPKGRNFNIIQHQLGNVLYDLEWNNGTSFFYTLDSSRQCSTAQLEVGILRPNWLDGANYLGQREVDGFLCNVWEKVDFIWYYEDVETKRPVHWRFYTGIASQSSEFTILFCLSFDKDAILKRKVTEYQ